MRRVLLFVTVFSVLLPLYADRITLHKGGEVSGKVVSFKDGVFRLDDGREVTVDEVKSVTFDTAKQEAKEEAVSADVKKLLDTAKEARKKYPDAKYIVLIDWGRYELNEDGTRSYEYHGAVLLCRREALGLANRSLYFEEGRSKVEILMARSISPDGTVHNYDPTKVKIESPARKAIYYGYGKYLVYTIPKVQVGSIIEFRYRSTTYKPFDKKMWFPDWWFGGKEPVVWSYIEMVFPNDVKLFYKTYDMDEDSAKPQVLVGKKKTTYIWEYHDFPGVVEEPCMPNIGDVVPRVRCSVFDNWVYINQWAAERLKKNMHLTESVKQAAAKITYGAKTDEEKVAKIYHWVQRNIRYISIKGSIMSGMCGHPAWETLKKGYGDCVDVAVLMSTLLRAVGVEAFPVWIQTNDSEAFIDLPNFVGNHAIVQVKLKDYFILDPTATDYRYPFYRDDDQGTYIHNPIRGVIEPTPIPPPEDNMRNMRTEVRIHPDLSATLEQLNTYTGCWESWVRGWFRRNPEQEHQKLMLSIANRHYPGSKVLSFGLDNTEDLSKEFRWRYRLKLARFGTKVGDFLIFGMPGVDYDFPEVALPKRRYDIHYSYQTDNASSCAFKHTITVTIPDGWRVYYIPEKVKLECKFADYIAEYTLLSDGKKILFEDKFRRKVRKIPVKDYEEYKRFLESVSAFSKKKVFLVKEKGE